MPINATQKITLKLVVVAIGMFVFAVFLMPPLYDVFCELTGIGGKTKGQFEGTTAAVDVEREIKIQFVATNNGAMPWEFSPLQYQVRVHPGEKTAVEFYAKNPTSRDMVAQAIPNITPNNAAEFFHKTECFCFDKQVLKAGEEANMGLVFIVDPELPASVTTITLSYTLFDVTEATEAAVATTN
ncbi:MAG: cytochrome c oxidase assembly protein [Gammaproteobacteria bacterium]|nr:cytochrome c oxidase assembly protein [Gammaproteobacteria bacterium]MBQ0839077.1 cytochrome c oxidase assembly protein [Gammaproteobacteria bacterium]